MASDKALNRQRYDMNIIIGILFSPMAFALCFLWPLVTQLVVALQFLESGWPAIVFGAVIATGLGLLAQFRESWVWIK